MIRAGNTHRRSLRGYVFLLPYALLFVPFLLWPILDGLRISLMRYELVSPTPPRFIGLGNYAEALADPYFRKALWVTIAFVLLTTPLTVVTSLGVAVALHRIPARRRSVYRTAMFTPCLLTVTVVAILWRWLYNGEFGPINHMLAPLGIAPPWLTEPGWSLLSIVLMTVWWTVGGPTVILLAGLGKIPETYHDAARIDGAGRWSTLWNVTLPLLRPALLFVVVLNLIASFQVFGQTFLVTHGGPELSTRVLVHYIFEVAFQGYRLGYGSAMSWLLFLLIAAFSAIQARLMRQ